MKRNLAAVSAVIVAIVIIVPSLLLVDMNTPSYKVSEGSSTYTMIGNLFGNNSISDSFSHLTASTVISEAGNNPDHINAVMSGSTLDLEQNNTLGFQLFLVVNGSIPGNLHPTGLTISVLPLYGMSWEFSDYVNNYTTQNKGVRITPTSSSPPASHNVTAAQGETQLNFTFKNDTGLKQNQTFNFFLMDLIDCGGIGIPTELALNYYTTYGISVALNLVGLNKPVYSVFYIYFTSIPRE